MKLLFTISMLRGGGAEGVLCTLANEMIKRGHHVTLVTTTNCEIYPIDDKVKLIEGREWRYDTFKGSFIVRYYKKMANRILDFVNLRRIVREEKPDLIMSFLLQWLFSLALLCRGKVPLIYADRNAVQFKFKNNNFFKREVLFRLADVVQVMSYHDKAYLRNKYKKVVTMPNPLRYDPQTREDFVDSFDKRKDVLAVGRLTPQKGFDKLIEAFAKIADKFQDWHLDICGEDMLQSTYSDVLKKKVSELDMDDRIRFIGFRKDIDQVMRSHAVFCLSSVHEGFPNVLSEAMANGMACVSFDIVTGPHEIIMDGLDGMIVEDQNVDSLAEGLAELMSNSKLRYEFGLHAIENIKRYNRERVADKWERLFIQTIKEF